MKTKCHICRGAKKMMKLGYVEGDCSHCDGKGFHIPKELPKEIKVLEALETISDAKIHTLDTLKNDEKKKTRG